MKNEAFILWYVNLYIYMDLMEFEINTNTNICDHRYKLWLSFNVHKQTNTLHGP
jgi:hypothetical protein